jgi:hypothetical protein
LFVTDQAGLRNQLYHNNGDGTFTRVDSGPELAMTGGGDSQGCAWGDYDNDGYLDLFLAGQDRNNALFHNNGDGTFTQILSEPPVQRGGNGITYDCVSWVDYDNDGSLDLFVTTAEYVFPSQQKNLLYHNNGSSNAWLEVKLVGAASNRSGIGVKVRAHATIGGKTFWQLREIGNAGGHNTPPLVAHFGFGDATNIDHVRIEWPSGIVQTLTNVSPRQILTVTEHQQSGPIAAPQFTSVALSPAGQAELSVLGPAGLLYVLEGSTDLSAWTKLAVKSNATTTVSFTDSQAASYANRFYRVSIP